MFVIAFSFGLYLMKKIYEKEKVSTEYVEPLLFYVVIATLLGARLGEVFFYNWGYYQNHIIEILLPIKELDNGDYKFTGFRGLASHGAAIGIIIAMYFYSKKVIQKPMLWILDRIVIPVASGAVFVRIGNLMNSEIIGKPTGTDYGFVFKQLGEDFPRHPTQLYESLGYVITFIVLWYVYWKTDKREKLGYLFGLFMVFLWSVRLIVEFFKEAQVDQRGEWDLNTGQLLSIPMILVGFYFMFRKTKK
jgi:prolipoprotein diacylglyceryl transferase